MLRGGRCRCPTPTSGPTISSNDRSSKTGTSHPDNFQKGLAEFINLADDYAAAKPEDANAAAKNLGPEVTDDPDPLITAPLYGRWHALTERLLTKRDGTSAPNPTNWVHRLNLDPRFRVPANFGTEVVEDHAEEYMNYAWEQIGDVLSANQKIRRLHFAAAASSRMFDRHVMTVASDPQRVLSLTAPVASSSIAVRKHDRGVAHDASSSRRCSPAAMRRVIRPARLTRSLPFTATVTRTNLLGRVNAAEVTSAPPKAIPRASRPSIKRRRPQSRPTRLRRFSTGSLATPGCQPRCWSPRSFSRSCCCSRSARCSAFAAAAVVAGGLYLFRRLRRWGNAVAASQGVSEAGQTASSVAAMPSASNFVLSAPGSTFVLTLGGTDSPTATRFKSALRDSLVLHAVGRTAAQRPAPAGINLTAVSAAMVIGVDPKRTIVRRGLASISLPPWIISELGDFFNVMAYPRIDLPMYKPLSDNHAEAAAAEHQQDRARQHHVDGNEPALHRSMVGLNHEFARKLLWREYPTDQRGSYFRQFWAVDNYIDSEGLSHDALQKTLYDIPETHLWRLDSALGSHNRAEPGHPAKPQAVLIIRGELLKKYPNTVIFAQHAKMVNACARRTG